MRRILLSYQWSDGLRLSHGLLLTSGEAVNAATAIISAKKEFPQGCLVPLAVIDLNAEEYDTLNVAMTEWKKADAKPPALAPVVPLQPQNLVDVPTPAEIDRMVKRSLWRRLCRWWL